MPELQVQKFLRGIGKVDYYTPATVHLDLLKAKYSIDYKQHSRIPNFYLLKYNQIESPFDKEIVRECRGLILDSADNWNVVCYSFNKWFNYGEVNAAKIDWSTARVEAKLDGSMICLSYYKPLAIWNVSTSGCPDGTNLINDTGETFNSLFWNILEKNYPDLVCYLDKDLTYIFELTGPLNRVVVDYKKSDITLIGVRDNTTFEEIKPIDEVCFINNNAVEDGFSEYPLKVAESYDLVSIDECIEAANKLNPLENEGYVVVDAAFNRIKVKSPAWVAIHHIKDTCSLAKIAEVIRVGEYQEFLTALDSYPEIKQKFIDLVFTYEGVINIIELIYSNIKNTKSQKEFAEKACKTDYSSVLFSMRKTGQSAKIVIKNMLKNSYLKLMGVKE